MVPPDGVEVAVLGPVAVRGAAEPFHRSAALDLVAYLALHRHGVRHAEWALAIWPDRAVALPTMHSTASDARRALGRARDGTPYLPRGVRLRLHHSVTTDVEHFAALAESDDRHRLVEAMHLVRGPLFDGLRRSDWAVFDGTRSRIESLVVRHRAARCRGVDARWRRQRGRLGGPSGAAGEPLRRTALPRVAAATAAEGGRVGVRSTMAELLTLAGEPERPAAGLSRVVRGGDGRLECLHPKTTALYLGLLEGSPAAEGELARL